MMVLTLLSLESWFWLLTFGANTGVDTSSITGVDTSFSRLESLHTDFRCRRFKFYVSTLLSRIYLFFFIVHSIFNQSKVFKRSFLWMYMIFKKFILVRFIASFIRLRLSRILHKMSTLHKVLTLSMPIKYFIFLCQLSFKT